MSRRPFLRAFLPLAALAAVVSVSFTSPARAGDTITIQSYDALFALREYDKFDLSGKGVTIALVNGPVDTSALELQSANITIVTPCPYISASDSISHGMAMTPLLALPNYGIAPGATILHYAIPLGDENLAQEDPGCSIDSGLILTRVLNDGANIISYPVIGSSMTALCDELMRADLDEVIVVAGMGDDNQEDDTQPSAPANLAVGVAAANTQGKRRDYSNYGKGITASLHAGSVSIHDYVTGQIDHEIAGISVATALTSGCLALAMGKWPEATNRQILQSLVRTVSRSGGIKQDQWYSYGITNYIALLVEDPRGRPSEDLLLHRSDDWASNEDLYSDYIDDPPDPGGEVITDPNYIYRGTNSDLVSVTPQNTAYGTSPRYH